jgi:hypothetical protein
MKKLITLFCIIVIAHSIQAQNTNVRAQGNYYSAKNKFQEKNYEEALNYVNKCKTALMGTNRELQYLHILAAYNLYKYEEAAKELQTYFDMEEKKVKIVYFDKSVDRLTDDETKQLSMLIDPILESVEHRKNKPCNRCFGKGVMKKSYTCNDCNGYGFKKEDCKMSKERYSCDNGKVECRCWKDCGSDVGCTGGWHYSNTYGNTRCGLCRGTGKVDCNNCNGIGYTKKDCNTCYNTGKVKSLTEEVICSKCYGKGF